MIEKVDPSFPETQKKTPVKEAVLIGKDKLPELNHVLTGASTTDAETITTPLPASEGISPGSTMVALTPAVATAIADPCEKTENDNPPKNNKIDILLIIVFILKENIGIIAYKDKL